ncbi:FtsB family cell division protein [Williamsia soli]|uniref:FtsB family cell division protein n=1 Tax=Williamsia soli TaxID=364929 RepID=UPI001A9E404D|nr:septum formation initiator family protein [Williamsia soli]
MAERSNRRRGPADVGKGPTRTTSRRAARGGPARSRATVRERVTPSLTLPRGAASLSSRWESINPKRAVVLAAVLSLLALTLAVPMRTYFSQQTEFDELRSSNAQLQAEVRDYEEKVAEQNDPAYIEAQARERLQFVMPGEKPLLMQYPVPPPKSDEERKAEKQAANPWYTNLWDSVSAPQK